MTEHVEEVVAAADLKEGDRVRVSFLGTVDLDGDLAALKLLLKVAAQSGYTTGYGAAASVAGVTL